MSIYSKLPTSEPPSPSIPLPDLSASSTQVRTYITTILNSKFGDSSSKAQEYASKWTIGTGRELRKYPLRMFCDIFEDPQVGWTVCKSVRVSMKEKEYEKRPKLGWEGRLPYIAAVVVLMVAGIAICWWNVNYAGIAAISWGAGLSLVAWLLVDAFRLDPESAVEWELNEAYKAMNQEQ